MYPQVQRRRRREEPAIRVPILAEDLSLETPQGRPGLEAELLCQVAARPVVYVEGVGLPATAVEREHQLCVQALAQRMILDELLQLGDHLASATECELGLESELQRRHPLLLERRDRRLRETGECDVRQRRPAPQRERLAQEGDRRQWIASLERGSGLRHHSSEAVAVKVARRNPQAVSRRGRAQHAFVERAP